VCGFEGLLEVFGRCCGGIVDDDELAPVKQHLNLANAAKRGEGLKDVTLA